MEKRTKVILGLTIVILGFQVAFALFLVNSLRENLPTESDNVSVMNRGERLDLLETLWQAEDFKKADEETRRKAFESIVVE